MRKIILGVDGGNTKTDYFLFDGEGNFIDFYRGPTCSHEQFKESYQGSYLAMEKVFNEFLKRNNLNPEDITSSVFGLAGVDTPKQKQKIEDVIKSLGFNRFEVVNDSFLGVKAATPYGYGVCSINGTGTSSGGIDKYGNYLQVGGIGGIVGDEAGGSYLARQVIRACYDEAYRFGKPTSLTKIVMDLLNVKDKYYLMESISEYLITRKIDLTFLTISLFKEANKGDEVSIEILKKVGENLARSTGGVVVNLQFDEEVDIVLAGSVWVKGSSDIMLNNFKKCINSFTNKKCNINILNVPPATGAIVWALEVANKTFPNKKMRDFIVSNVEKELEKIEGR